MTRQRWRAMAMAAMVAAAAGACGRNSPSIAVRDGSESKAITGVWWLMFALAAAVYAVVGGLVIASLLRGKRKTRPESPRPARDNAFIVIGGIVVPIAILMLLAAVTVRTTTHLRNPRAGELRINVTGRRWWWEVRYPDAGVTTANEIHVPVGRQVDIRLRTTDVIHSFWVPRLAGKVDTIPDQTNDLRVTARRAGTYLGECAEFCGLQHANMRFTVIAEAPADFGRWLSRRGAVTATPSNDEQALGQVAFEREACAGCHTIRGTTASGIVGPDLSDFGERRSIGAGTVPNTPARLAAWIANAQSLKPGIIMPPFALDPREVDALVAYLESLK
jgi:cytochrome c oxidase subunit 2